MAPWKATTTSASFGSDAATRSPVADPERRRARARPGSPRASSVGVAEASGAGDERLAVRVVGQRSIEHVSDRGRERPHRPTIPVPG